MVCFHISCPVCIVCIYVFLSMYQTEVVVETSYEGFIGVRYC